MGWNGMKRKVNTKLYARQLHEAKLQGTKDSSNPGLIVDEVWIKSDHRFNKLITKYKKNFVMLPKKHLLRIFLNRYHFKIQMHDFAVCWSNMPI